MSLKDKVVAVVRPPEQSKDLADALSALGGTPYVAPLIEVKPPSNPEALHSMIKDAAAGKVDVIIFMSRNGVLQTLEAAKRINLLEPFKEASKKITLVAVGPKTKQELEKLQLGSPIMPEEYSSSGVVKLLEKSDLKGKTVALPRAQVVDNTLRVALEKLGAKVIEATAYDVIEASDKSQIRRFIEDLTAGMIDVIAFTSPSTVKSLLNNAKLFHLDSQIKNKLQGVVIASIGPTTKKALEEIGFQVQVMPQKYTIEALATEIALYFQKNEQTGSEKLDDVDRHLIQLLQYGFPLVAKPWAHLADKIGMDSATVMSRVQKMIDLKIIRKIGSFPDLKKIGFRASTLVGIRVPQDKIPEVAEVINKMKNVSHNYLREHKYNLWFTLNAKEPQEIQEAIELLKKAGLQDQDILNLQTLQSFKIDVRFTPP